jgi:hypothetical protein
MYDETGFPDTEMSLGYAINVYQESINMAFREYLVNFDYFKQVMKKYGFELLNEEELKNIGLPSSTGLFRELFSNMENEILRNKQSGVNYKNAAEMSKEEKEISFLNRYFIFRKMIDVDAKKMTQLILKEDELLENNGEKDINEIEENLKKSEQEPVEKLTKPKLIIKNSQKKQVVDVPPTKTETSELVEVKQIIPPKGQTFKLKIRNPN